MTHQDYDEDLEYHMNRLRREYESKLGSEDNTYIEDILEGIPLPLLVELRQHYSVVSLSSVAIISLKRVEIDDTNLFDLLLDSYDWELINEVYKSRRTPISHMTLEDLLAYLAGDSHVLALERGYNTVTKLKVRKFLTKHFRVESKLSWFAQPILLERFSALDIANARDYYDEYCSYNKRPRVKVDNITSMITVHNHVPYWDNGYDDKLNNLHCCLKEATIPDIAGLIVFMFRVTNEWDKGTSVDMASNFPVVANLEKSLPCCDMDWDKDAQYMLGVTNIRFLLRSSAGFQEIGGGQLNAADDIYIVVENVDPELKIRVTKDYPYARFCPRTKTFYSLRIEKILGRGAFSYSSRVTPGLDPRKYTIYRLLMETFPPDSVARLLWVTTYSRDRVYGTRPFLIGGGAKYFREYEESDVVSRALDGPDEGKCFYFSLKSAGKLYWDFYQIVEDLLKHQLTVEVLSNGEKNQVNAWLRLKNSLLAGQPVPPPPLGFVEDCGTLVKVNVCLLHSKRHYEEIRENVVLTRNYLDRHKRKILWHDQPKVYGNSDDVPSFERTEAILNNNQSIDRRKRKVSKNEDRGRKKKRHD